MKIVKKRKTNKKIIAVVVVAILLAAAGAATVYKVYFSKSNVQETRLIKPAGTVDYESATDEQVQAGADQKERTQDAEVPGADDSVVVTMHTLVSDGSLRITSQISEITNDGTCTLTLKRGDIVITKEAGIQAGPSLSTCKGFTVSDNLETGQWKATLTVVIGDRSGSASEEFTVQ